MLTKQMRIFESLALTSLLMLFAAPELALAASPFTSAVTGFQEDATLIFQVIAVIGIMAVGVCCLTGKIHKGWLVACVIGIILVFGAEQIVTWIRGAAGV
jgi:type IV secretion system protein VirB2